MTSAEELLDVFKQKIIQPKTGMIPAKVKSVGKTTCTVSLVENDMIIEDVQLSASEGEQGLLVIPKAESAVNIISMGGDENTYYVTGISEIDEVVINIENTAIRITKDGTHISRDGMDLKNILTNFVKIVAGIVVVQGKGPDISKLKETIDNINKVLT